MKKTPMKVGIIRFPGSNCDFDALRFFQKHGHKAEFVWYTDKKMRPYDLIVIPGGFAFGDRVYKKATASYIIEPGTLAVTSPVMKLVKEFIKKGVPVLGICNGFQILVKAGVLPGRLEQNKSKEFYCNWTECEVVGDSFFGDASLLNKTYKIPVAHGYGRYEIDEKEYSKLEKNKQIFLKYKNGNPNGSYKNIAGITNKEKTVFGMMPHPERTPDGSYFMKAIENYTSRSSLNKLQ